MTINVDGVNPTEPPITQLPALQESVIPGNAVCVLGAMHKNATQNFLRGKAPNIDFPSMWRMAKQVVFERGPILAYGYTEDDQP